MQRWANVPGNWPLQTQTRTRVFKNVQGNLPLKIWISTRTTRSGRTISAYLVLTYHILKKCTRITHKQCLCLWTCSAVQTMPETWEHACPVLEWHFCGVDISSSMGALRTPPSRWAIVWTLRIAQIFSPCTRNQSNFEWLALWSELRNSHAFRQQRQGFGNTRHVDVGVFYLGQY